MHTVTETWIPAAGQSKCVTEAQMSFAAAMGSVTETEISLARWEESVTEMESSIARSGMCARDEDARSPRTEPRGSNGVDEVFM